MVEGEAELKIAIRGRLGKSEQQSARKSATTDQ
jgi:hypothetical protein